MKNKNSVQNIYFQTVILPAILWTLNSGALAWIVFDLGAKWVKPKILPDFFWTNLIGSLLLTVEMIFLMKHYLKEYRAENHGGKSAWIRNSLLAVLLVFLCGLLLLSAMGDS